MSLQGRDCWENHNLIPYNHSKKGLHGVMSKLIKDLSKSFSSSIGFEVE